MNQATKEKYIKRCFQICQRTWRTTKTNPIVGAVLVYNDRIIGEGYHKVFGEAHAEVNCIANVAKGDEEYIEHSSLFLSLEPCSYVGKTAACSTLILNKRIPRVYISCQDPNPLVSGKGIKILEKHGVHVESGILEKEGQIILRKFKVNMLQKRPFIALKWAQSQHGYSGIVGESVWYTGQASKVKAHALRSQFDAILVGTNTVLLDNPTLNNRLAPGINPTRIVIDLSEKIDKKKSIFQGEQETIIVTKKPDYKLPNPNFQKCILIEGEMIDWSSLFAKLFDFGISSVLIEGGPSIHKSIANERLWDEAHILSSKHQQNHGLRAPTLIGRRLESVTLGSDRYDHILASH
ncbi:bifunctional diaminohydroxyphosphoribosylaminopyrimidine deaminase/5-amino-6-(5-phosphoribosylamino)uracil reductase RibD [Saprospiraceae bacterium]|nr:bifunctional diaminohydroxyphosphoribosylaminopyrimidine deaminase/5-amino-6-(5-phosphoribosylamino)uracil reductase RibD [Saprospiraceae bacterium]